MREAKGQAGGDRDARFLRVPHCALLGVPPVTCSVAGSPVALTARVTTSLCPVV